MPARRWGVVLVLAGVVAGGGCFLRQAQVPHASIVAYPTRELELANGMRVVLETAPDFGEGGAVLVLGAGASAEPAGQAGLAHLAEHLIFNAEHGGVSLAQRERDLGWQANASTSWDETMVFAFADAGAIRDVVSFLAGAVVDPLAGVDEAAFQRELRAVGNEMRMRTEKGTPGQAFGLLMTAVFPKDHPYGHPIAGTPETLAALRFEDVRAFARAHYRPETSTLVVSAPLGLDDAQAMVERILGQRAQAPPAPWRPRPRAAAPPVSRSSFETREAAVATPTLWMGWAVPPASGEQEDLGILVTSLLENASFELQEQDRDIAGVSAGVLEGTAASLLWVEVALKDAKHPERTARVVADQMTHGVEVFREQKWFTATQYAYLDEGLAERAMNLAWSAQQIGDPMFLRRLDQRIQHRSESAVQDYARSFLGAGRGHVLLLRPSSSLPVAGGLAPPAAGAAPAPVAARAAPLPVGETRPILGRLETHRLSNGLTLILVPRQGSPFHTVLLGFRGGQADATPPGVGVAAAWGRQWEQWSPAVFGVDYHHSVGEDSTLEVLRSTGSDVGATLDHLARLLGFSTFWPPKQFTRRLEVFERKEQAPLPQFERALARATFGAHPLGFRPTAREIQKITPSEVLRWISRVRRPGNAAVVVVGDFDPKRALEAAEAKLGTWGATVAPAQRLDPLLPLEQAADAGGGAARLVMHDRPGAQQAYVRVRCLLPLVTPDHAATPLIFAQVVERVLRARLREEMGASYHVTTDVGFFAGGTTVFDLRADVRYDQLARALASIRAVIGPEGRGSFGQETFDRARWSVARPLNLDTRSLAETVFDDWNLGWPLDTFDRLPAEVRATRPDEVGAIADHCAQNVVIGVLGDARLTRGAEDAAVTP
jgi:zinc protease